MTELTEVASLQTAELAAYVWGYTQLFKPLIKRFLPEYLQTLVIVSIAGGLGALANAFVVAQPMNPYLQGAIAAFAVAGIVSSAKELTNK